MKVGMFLRCINFVYFGRSCCLKEGLFIELVRIIIDDIFSLWYVLKVEKFEFIISYYGLVKEVVIFEYY